MKKILNFLKERPILTIQLTVLAFLLAALAVSVAILISVKPWNLMNNSIDDCYADKARVTIDLEPEERTYESIKTLYFTFYDDRGNETAFSDGNVDLTKLIDEMNRYLTTVHNRVCSIGVVGSKLFIQLDTRYEDDRTKHINIQSNKINVSQSKIKRNNYDNFKNKSFYNFNYVSSLTNIEELKKDILIGIRKNFIDEINKLEVLNSELYVLSKFDMDSSLLQECNDYLKKVKQLLDKTAKLREMLK